MHIHHAEINTRVMRKTCDKEPPFSSVCMLFLYFCISCSNSLSSSPSTLLPLSSLFFFVVHPSQCATKSDDNGLPTVMMGLLLLLLMEIAYLMLYNVDSFKFLIMPCCFQSCQISAEHREDKLGENRHCIKDCVVLCCKDVGHCRAGFFFFCLEQMWM